jgi:formylglycine-generating enzyme required for sulfatase activity
MSLTTDLPKYRPDLVGEDPGDECYLDLTPDAPREETRMVFCWCPPAPEKNLLGFWLGKYLVTHAQWTALGLENLSHLNEGDQQPVDNVSWYGAGRFAERSRAVMPAGYELWLPAEAQWKRACRAGRDFEFGIGAGHSLNSQLANFDGSHLKDKSAIQWLNRKKPLPVGCFPPNDWGLHDMHGQLWEWCADRSEGKGGYRITHGGSWSYYAWNAAVSFRRSYDPLVCTEHNGLRVTPCTIQTRRTAQKGPNETNITER